MRSNGRALAKRGRTPASTSQNAKSPRNVSEELAQVTGLVERRRLQNRISQQNYRNKIRVRLEQLEAMVDANANDEGRSSDNKKSSSPPKATTSQVNKSSSHSPALNKISRTEVSNQLPEIPAEASEIWRPMPEFSNLTEESFTSHCLSPQMHDLGISFDALPMENLAPPSIAESVSSEFNCVSTLPSESGDYDPTSTSIDVASSSFPAMSEAEQIDSRFSPMNLNPDSPRHSFLDLAPRGHFSHEDTPPLYSTSQLNAALIPTAGGTYSSTRVDGSVGDLTSHTPWHGASSLRPPQIPYLSPQQYVWVPIPISTINMSPGILKPLNGVDTSFDSRVR